MTFEERDRLWKFLITRSVEQLDQAIDRFDWEGDDESKVMAEEAKFQVRFNKLKDED